MSKTQSDLNSEFLDVEGNFANCDDQNNCFRIMVKGS